MAILVKFGDKIKGESKVEGFTDHFEVNSFQWGVGRGVSAARGTSTREGSVASVSEITFTKQTDGTTVKFIEEAIKGKLDNKVHIAFIRTGSGNAEAYFEFNLEGCGVTGYSVSSGGDRPAESLSLNFDKVEWKYKPVGDDLTGSPESQKYDLATTKIG